MPEPSLAQVLSSLAAAHSPAEVAQAALSLAAQGAAPGLDLSASYTDAYTDAGYPGDVPPARSFLSLLTSENKRLLVNPAHITRATEAPGGGARLFITDSERPTDVTATIDELQGMLP